MKSWLKPILVILLPALAAAWWFRPREASAGEPRYRTAPVSKGDIVQTVTATGTLAAVTTVQVGSQVSGKIVRLHADYNDPVKAGQLIAEIDPAIYEAKAVQAEGELASAQATLELKQVNFRRAEELLKQSLLSQSDYDQSRAELRQQEAAVRIKEAVLKSAQLDVGYARIYSPIEGVVISRDIDVGQTVQASFSAPELFEIAQDLRQMQIAANVSEADIGGIEPGQPVTFTVDAFSGRAFRAQVRQVRKNATTTSNVVTYTTIISVDNSDLKLLPGMTANVVITIARRSGVLRVANSALRFTPPAGARLRPVAIADPAPGRPVERLVYLLAAAPGPDGRASGELIPTPVRTGLSDVTHTEIVSDLEAGRIVATGTVASGISISPSPAGASSSQTTNPFSPKPPGGGPPPR